MVDRLSTSGTTPLHRMAPVPKLIAAGLLLASVAISQSFADLATVLGFIALVLAATRQPVREILHLAAYPLIFGVVFALAQLPNGIEASSFMILKVFAAGLVAATTLATTTFVDVFAVLGHVLPKVLLDAMFVAYRAFFILMKEISNFLTVIRLRGTSSPGQVLRMLKTYGEMLGVVAIHSVDLSERMYQVMYVRGYKPGLGRPGLARRISVGDAALMILCAAVLLGVLAI